MTLTRANFSTGRFRVIFTICNNEYLLNMVQKHVVSRRRQVGKRASCGRDCDALPNVCWKTLGFGIQVDVILTDSTYLNIDAAQVHPFMATAFPNAIGTFDQQRVLLHFKTCPAMV